MLRRAAGANEVIRADHNPQIALSLPIEESSATEHETAELHSGAEAVSLCALLVSRERFVRQRK
jgi:hypothetical protein